MPRQHYSCDQCRRSKRACDAPQLEVPAHLNGHAASILSGNLPAPETKQCSYCRRTGKTCTMNWAWQQIQVSLALQAASRQHLTPTKSQKRGYADDVDTRGYTISPTTGLPDVGIGEVSMLPDADLNGVLSAPLSDDLFDLQSLHPDASFPFPPQPIPSLEGGMPFNLSDPFAPTFPTAATTTYHHPGAEQHMEYAQVDRAPTFNPSPSLSSTSSFSPHQPAARSSSFTSFTSPGSSSSSSSSDLQRSNKRRRRRYTPEDTNTTNTTSSSPSSMALCFTSPVSRFSIDQKMMAAATTASISSGLLQIYHDVLEHNLSCWLTEVTCPYKGVSRREDALQLTEWGPSWSNRVLQRTVKLDRAARETGLVKTTKAQDRAASRALHSAIMAFATQWAQGSRRQRRRYRSRLSSSSPSSSSSSSTSSSCYSDGDDIERQMTEEFDRSIQRHFWAQARAALDDVAHLESYKVACAELVFGLAQRPWSEEDEDDEDDDRSAGFVAGGEWDLGPGVGVGVSGGGQTDPFDTASLMTEIDRIVEKDGPPVYIERAMRRMQALKRRFEASSKGWAGPQSPQHQQHQHQHQHQQQQQQHQHAQYNTKFSHQRLEQEDEKTVGLIYWLAVMFDTVSSGMNERPLSVTDEDSQHERVAEQHGKTDDGPDGPSRGWKVELFIDDDVTRPRMRTTWPCSYQEAAEAVTRSAPAKVLLYRHLAHLQTVLLQQTSAAPDKVEAAISRAAGLHRYWNVTHGAFFRDLVRHYRDVPARIRSWFVCISAHWHLAVLMLADLVEFADARGRGLALEADARRGAGMVANMRAGSAAELADLARVSTPAGLDGAPGAYEAAPEMPGLHHAVNEGTIMTEPWTVILIRAFSRAAVLMMRDAGSRRQQQQYGLATAEDKTGRSGVEDCIRALFYLGRKSDMAMKVADVLEEALVRARAD
ncbi:hypothetical protein MCOR21_005245 [Pyricularia oryzae]|nr:hypothetical protein MCOR21_005245 [Pyricularia oryzae]KAI6487053.1 hypothetical protein MCOR11_009028 [Pyricularia oryzae]